MMLLSFFKAVHIVGAVAWFAGLFYLVRMFVYHVESFDQPAPERDILSRQFNLMERRAFGIICRPAMVFTWIFGGGMLFLHGWEWFQANWWMHIKLVLLVLLSAYTDTCKGIIQKLERGERPFNSFQFRLMNEVPTLFLLGIVLLAVYRNAFNAWYALGGILAFGLLLFVFAKLYKKARMKKIHRSNGP